MRQSNEYLMKELDKKNKVIAQQEVIISNFQNYVSNMLRDDVTLNLREAEATL